MCRVARSSVLPSRSPARARCRRKRRAASVATDRPRSPTSAATAASARSGTAPTRHDRLRPDRGHGPLPHLHRRGRRQRRAPRRLRRLARRPASVPRGMASAGELPGDAGREERARARLGRRDAGLRRLHRLLAGQPRRRARLEALRPAGRLRPRASPMPRSRPTAASSSGPSASEAPRLFDLNLFAGAYVFKVADFVATPEPHLEQRAQPSAPATSNRAARWNRWPPTTGRSRSTAPT